MRQNYNKKNKCLALLGQGKWKHALRSALVLMGIALMGTGVYAQSYEGGKLQMSKKFYPTKDDNTEGELWLETYVTGAQFTTSISVPADIVLVLDLSQSMTARFGNTTRLQALHDAVSDFMDVVKTKDIPNAGTGTGENHITGHRVAVVSFSAASNYQYRGTYLLSTDNRITYGSNQMNTDAYRNALKEITVNGAINTHLKTTTVNRIADVNQNYGTYAQYGLEMAYNVLNSRETTTFVDSNGNVHDRSTIVVFFTDGYVGGDGDPTYFYVPESNNATTRNQAGEADLAVYRANQIKGIQGPKDHQSAVIYTVGIYDNANPRGLYTTQFHAAQQQGQQGDNRRNYYYPKREAADGLMHMISSDYDYVEGMSQPNYSTPGFFRNNTINPNNDGSVFFYTDDQGGEHESKFFSATDQGGLSTIFTSIASSAGSDPINMTSGTMVQDVISPTFTLQGGTNVDAIEVYAVKCTYAEVDASGNVTNCEFNTDGGDALGYGTKTSYSNGQIQYLTLINNPGGDNHGAVDETTAEGKENRLRSGEIVEIVEEQGTGNPQVNITGFNFKAMYCGEVVLNGVTTYVGRKLVIKIPIKVKDGIWGDDFNTNGEMSLVQPDGSTTTYEFERPITNVMGSVWTEKVTFKPSSFPEITSETQTIEIGTPEELAWFVSEVNGRIHYGENNTVASHPKLNAILTADIDMSAHNWVPIGAGYKCNDQDQYVDANGVVVYQKDDQGNIMLDDDNIPITVPTVKLAYEGTFDGNGHVITGLKNNVAKYYKLAHGEQYVVVVFPGMFSNVKGTVKNVHVLDSDFRARNHDRERETFVHFGIIADTLSSGGEIFNCEAVGRITCNDVETNATGEVDQIQLARDSEIVLGGLVGYNNGGTIHSCMAMPTLTGYTMGGMIGLNEGSFTNGFTNPVFNYLDNDIVMPVGGIAGVNVTAANIQNCYVRFSRSSNKLDEATFGQVVGDGVFTQTSCFTPRSVEYQLIGGNNAWDNTVPVQGVSENLYSVRRNPSHMRYDRSNDNMVASEWQSIDGVSVLKNGIPLLNKLNDAVSSLNAALEEGDQPYSSWKRTTAGNYPTSPNGGDINGDYPVLVYEGYTCLASNNNGIGIDYATSLDEMLDRHNNYTLNKTSTWNSNAYKDTPVTILKGGAINLFANETTRLGTSSEAGTVLYIDENVSLLQNTSAAIDAYTGQTIIDYGSTEDPQSGNRWHNVSSSLQNSKFGLDYEIKIEVPSALNPDAWDSYVAQYQPTQAELLVPENPCVVIANVENDDEAIFPTDMRSFHPFDFYCFYEPQYHWLNFKRNRLSHWHMDDPTLRIPYDNQETQFIPGKGYLLALHFEYFDNLHVWTGNNLWNTNPDDLEKKDRTFLQNRGTLNNGPVNIPVTYTAANEWTGLAGYNLLGNPYQSFLDFDEFVNAEANADLWSGSNYAQTYAVFDPSDMATTGAKGGKYLQYKSGSSDGSNTASQYINMHQGFFIQVGQNGTAYFTNAMRTNDATPNFRGARPAYPLINFTLTDNEGQADVAVLEVGRPENDGAMKLRVGSATGRISLRHDDTDFGILFRDMTEGSQPLRFETQEDGTFTLSWNTANANFSSLTLVDNITGVNYDMLAHDSYEFEGRASDYKSRFKILIGEFTDVEENEETVTNNFAFFDGSEWVVNGKGQLTVSDVMGRMVYTDNLTNDQNRVSLNGLSQGVYLMQVHSANGTMVQKIVVR